MKLKTALDFLKMHGEWIMALIAAIIAVVSLYITWQTLNEMTKERDSAYRPDVVILQENYVLETYVPIKMDDEGNICVLECDNSCSFKIINIGVGTAKDVKVKFNDNSAVQLAKWINANVEHENEIHISDSSNGYYIFTSLDKEGNIAGHATSGGERDILYILPDAEQEYSLYVPDAYIYLLQKTYFINKETPELTMEITWQDVQGKTYKKEYIIETTTIFGDTIGANEKDNTIEYVKNNIESFRKEDGSYEARICVHLKEIKQIDY